MGSNARERNNTLEETPFRQEDLIDPDKNTIAVVLDEALKQNYATVNVEWVTSYSDLSEPPFNLAAPGISGNTALLDFGDESYFKLPFTEMNVYNFKDFLKSIHRDNSNSFIFGYGAFRRISKCRLSEIVLNAFIPSATNKELKSRNSSGLTEIDTLTGKCKKKMLSLSELQCAAQGTYFLSEGLHTDDPVLKVYAKEPTDEKPFCGSNRFINLMQEALEKKFGSEHFVALGGVYAVNNIFWRHKLIQNDWEPSYTIPDCHCCVSSKNTSEIMITTFNSSTKIYPKNSGPPIKLSSSQTIHSLFHHSSSENHPVIYETNDEEEYLGYFCPAKSVYRIDQPCENIDE